MAQALCFATTWVPFSKQLQAARTRHPWPLNSVEIHLPRGMLGLLTGGSPWSALDVSHGTDEWRLMACQSSSWMPCTGLDMEQAETAKEGPCGGLVRTTQSMSAQSVQRKPGWFRWIKWQAKPKCPKSSRTPYIRALLMPCLKVKVPPPMHHLWIIPTKVTHLK